MITFTNQPKLSIHEIDTRMNERRLSLIPHVETFLSEHPLFKNKDVQVTFPEAGSSSFTSIVNAEGIKNVLKISLNSQTLYENEGSFLKAWEKVGVKVPHVIEEGWIDKSYYLLMEFVDAMTIDQTYRKGAMVKNEIFVAMGSTLRLMHRAKSQKFGAIKEKDGGYALFSDWLRDEIEMKAIYTEGKHFLDDEKHGNFTKAVQVISDYVGTSSESTYCHNDFAYQNIFATDPLTVFDPVPTFGHPYMDLARAIIIAMGRGLPEDASEQLMRGYSGNDLTLNRSVLQAALIIQAYMKFPYWSKTANERRIHAVLQYLEKTKDLLIY